MGDFITQEEFNKWSPDSLAPITHEVTFLNVPIDIIEKHYANWMRQWAEDVQDRMYVQFNRKQATADLSWVDARREDLPGLLLPQNMLQDRSLFCSTDSPWTAIFTPTGSNLSMIESLQSFIFNRNEPALDGGPAYVHLTAKPCISPVDLPFYVADSVGSPYTYFQSNGSCCISFKDPVSMTEGANFGRWLELGHRSSPRSQSILHSSIDTGFQFTNLAGREELGIDSEDFISELPDSFDDIGKELVMGPEIWNVFGFREMEMICADFGIRPFDKDFYSDRGLLTTMWFENEPRFTAVPRVDFKHYQRMIGVGPDIIRSR
ncbi:hypothetical protein ACTXPQ_14410 [Candidatus Corynebacterium faecigallinarum]